MMVYSVAILNIQHSGLLSVAVFANSRALQEMYRLAVVYRSLAQLFQCKMGDFGNMHLLMDKSLDDEGESTLSRLIEQYANDKVFWEQDLTRSKGARFFSVESLQRMQTMECMKRVSG